jgi:hypothetical protein
MVAGSAEQLTLRRVGARWLELAAVQAGQLAIKPQAARGLGETLGDEFGERALAAHALAEGRVVVAAAAHLLHQAHHVLGAFGQVRGQPVAEDRRHLVRQAQQYITRRLGAGRGDGVEDTFEEQVGDHRDHRRHQHAHRHAGRVQAADAFEAPRRRAGARFQPRGEAIVEAGHRDHHVGKAGLAHRAEQVEVAFDQRVLGDDRQRMPGRTEHLDQLAGEPALALQRLVGVGVGADGDRRAAVGPGRQLCAEQRSGIGLGEQPGLEVEAGREVEVGVGRAGEAVAAATFYDGINVCSEHLGRPDDRCEYRRLPPPRIAEMDPFAHANTDQPTTSR